VNKKKKGEYLETTSFPRQNYKVEEPKRFPDARVNEEIEVAVPFLLRAHRIVEGNQFEKQQQKKKPQRKRITATRCCDPPNIPTVKGIRLARWVIVAVC